MVLPSPLAAANSAGADRGRSGFPAARLGDRRARSPRRLLISLIGGLGLGVLLGAHRLSGEVAEPMLVALYSIPKITLYPVILLLFGLGISAKIAFGVMHGIIPVILFTHERGAQHPPGLSSQRTRHAPDARADGGCT